MLASRLFREIYDIALLKRTEKRTGKEREQRAKLNLVLEIAVAMFHLAKVE